jgi:hypothetical protein
MTSEIFELRAHILYLNAAIVRYRQENKDLRAQCKEFADELLARLDSGAPADKAQYCSSLPRTESHVLDTN